LSCFLVSDRSSMSAASVLGVRRGQSTAKDKRAVELSRWFAAPSVAYHHHHHYQQQQQVDDDRPTDAGDVFEWTSHAWTFDELLRLYSKKLPVIVRASRGYYGQPAAMQLNVGQVGLDNSSLFAVSL